MKDNDCPKHVQKVLNDHKDEYDKKFIDILHKICNFDHISDGFRKYDESDDDDEQNEYINKRNKEIDDDNHSFLVDLNEEYFEIEGNIYTTKRGDPIYRGLIVKDYSSFIKDLPQKNVGIYWTWNKSNARPEGDEQHSIKENLVILKGINPTNIDEEETYETNLELEVDEKEIRLKYGSQIFLDEVCRFKKSKKGKLKQVCNKIGKRIKV